MSWRIVLICLLLGPMPMSTAWAQDEAEFTTFDEFRDQGLLYLRRKKKKLAYRFLTKAYAFDAGKTDFKTVYNRGQAAHELLLLEVAYQMLAEAKPLVGNSARRKRDADELEGLLSSLYGQLAIEPATGETNRQGRIFFESQGRIINKKKRALFDSIRKRFRATELTIPTTVYLPHGRFTANNVPVEIAEGQAATARIYLQVERNPAAGGVNGWWITGVGAATAIVSSVGAYFLFADRDPKTFQRLVPRVVPPEGPALRGAP